MTFSVKLRDNEQLSRLCAEQEARLGDLEQQVESRAQEVEDRRRMLEDVQSDKATISRALTQNRTLKDQLAELQNGFVKLVRQIFEFSANPPVTNEYFRVRSLLNQNLFAQTNENMELTSAIQSEQHVKKELARRMGELQEQLHSYREQVRSRTRSPAQSMRKPIAADDPL